MIIFGDDQAAPDANHLELPAGERAGELLALLLEYRKITVDALQSRGGLGAITDDVCAKAEILLHRHAREGFFALRDLHEATLDDGVRPQAVDPLAVERDRAAPGLDEAGGCLEQRRLAGSVAAEQRDNLAALHLQAGAIEDLHAAVAADEILDVEHRCVGHHADLM
jgi:hypothetical protein